MGVCGRGARGRSARSRLATFVCALVAACGSPKSATDAGAPPARTEASAEAGTDAAAASGTNAAAGTGANAGANAATDAGTEAGAAAGATASGPGRVAQGSFQSASLGVQKSYFVYLPGGYDASGRRYPVIYLLHGLGGDESNWVKVGGLPRTADSLGLAAIVVMPDGDDGFYSNWASPPQPYDACLAERPQFNRGERPETYCVKQARYEDYIVKDLVAHVDQTYRTVADRKGRALAGLSMGGFGALMLAMRHKEVFSATASHSGLVSLLYGGPHPYVRGAAGPVSSLSAWGAEYRGPMRPHMLQIFGGDLAAWRAHDPSALAARLSGGDLAIFIDCGTEDGFKFQDQALYLHEVLETAKVAHAFALVPGGHDFSLWKVRIRESLAFHADHFRRAGL